MISLDFFAHEAYRRHNCRRQEHLASLALPLEGKTVLELGAGVGDHTSFFLDRKCQVTVTDAREQNLVCVRTRFPSVVTRIVDVEKDFPSDLGQHDIVYAYGLLYHLAEPGSALFRMASVTKEMLLVETCVSFGAHKAVNHHAENVMDPTQAAHGMGCRPTRPWIFETMHRLFAHVYLPETQPWHEEFPTHWNEAPTPNVTGLYRSVFIGSRRPLDNSLLSKELLNVQSKK